MKKKTLSLFLVLVMCLSLVPTGVFAQDNVTVQEQTPEQTETVADPEQQVADSESWGTSGDEQDVEESQAPEDKGSQESEESAPQTSDDEESTSVPAEDETYQGITFRYGNGNSLNVTLPEKSGYYTYGTSSDDGTVIAVTEENVSTLPKTGWNWAVWQCNYSGSRGIYDTYTGNGYVLQLWDFHLMNNGSGAAIESQETLYIDLLGDNEVTATAEDSAAVLVSNSKLLRISSIADNTYRTDDIVGIGTLKVQGGAYGVQVEHNITGGRSLAIGASATVTATGAKAGVKAGNIAYFEGVLTAIGTGTDSCGIEVRTIRMDSTSGTPLDLTAEGQKAAFSASYIYGSSDQTVKKVGSSATDAADWKGTDSAELADYKYVHFQGTGIATVSDFSQLSAAISQTSPVIRRIYVTKNITMTSKLTIKNSVSIVGVGNKAPVLSRGSSFKYVMFQINGGSEYNSNLGLVRMQNIIIDGKNIEATAPAIYLAPPWNDDSVPKGEGGYGCLVLGSRVEIRNCINKGYVLGSDNTTKSVSNSKGNGGAINVAHHTSLTMYPGSKITNCQAYKGGGLYISRTNSGTAFYGVTISGNTALKLVGGSTTYSDSSAIGGGIYSGDNDSFYDCIISGNTAEGFGGGVYGDADSSALYTDCVVESNKAKNGGGIYNYKKCTVKDSVIRNNEATVNAGGITVGEGTQVINCNILNNKASEKGGGLYGKNGVTITECTVKNNEALNGGGAYVEDSAIKFIDCKISNNNASQNGGGIYSYGVCNVNGGTVNNNTATNNGGGVYNYLYGTNTLTDVHVYANNANNGGGIFAEGNLTLDNTKIYENTATVNGGGLCGGYTNSNSASQITKDTEIYSNKAANGGGVYLRHGGKTWILSGIVKVRGNTLDDGTTHNDLFVQAKGTEGYYRVSATLITIGRDEVKSTDSDGNETIKTVGLAGLGDDSYIGLTMEEYPEIGEQTTVAKCGLAAENVEGDTPDYSKYFHTEDTKYICSTNVAVADDGTATREVVLGRKIVAIDKPAGEKLTYNGNKQKGVAENDGYTLSGDVTATDVGTYNVTATLNAGYKWSDGSEDTTANTTWSIEKKTPEASNFTFAAPAADTLIYDGTAKEAKVTLNEPYTGIGTVTVKYYNDKGEAVEPVNAGTYTVKISVPDGKNFTAAEDLTDENWKFTVLRGSGLAAPECTFSFNGENGSKLMGATADMEYSLDGGKTWTDCTKDITLSTDGITSENGIQVRVKETLNNAAGEVKTIDITENENIPAVGKVNCLSKGNTGKLTDVTAEMEYSSDNGKTWTAITGDTVEGLAGGNYKVRYKAAGTVLPSKAQELVIDSYIASEEKALTSFKLGDAVGVINEKDHTVTVTVPYGTDVTKLSPEITVSNLATVSPASGEVNDFTKPVKYTVTAENDSTQDYIVTVTVELPKLLTVTAPADKTLAAFAETADAAISELPKTVAITSENTAVKELECTWTLVGTSFDKTPDAVNKFHWRVNTDGFNINGKIVEGDVAVTNRAAIKLAVAAPGFNSEKTYDGTTAVNVSVTVGALTGVLKDDIVQATAKNAVYDSKNAGDRTVTVSYEISGKDAWKYLAPDDSTVNGKIVHKKVTITGGITAVNRTYEAGVNTVTLSVGEVEVSGLVGSDKVSVDMTDAVGTMDDDKAGTNKTVTITGIKLSAADVNYVLKEQPIVVTVDITRASYTAKVFMSDYAYGSTVSAPSIDKNPENGAVTYYYNKANSSQGGTEWKGITSTALPVDTYYMYAVIAQTENYNSVTTDPVAFNVNGAAPEIKAWPTISGTVYVNDTALTDERLTGGNAAVDGKFTITGETKSWSDSGEKQLKVTFTPSDKNYSAVEHDITVNVIKRTVTSVVESAAITDKTFKTEQSALGLPTETEITVSGDKKFTVPVSWSGYNAETLEEQTLTGTLDLSEISAEVQQPENEVKASVKVTLQPIKLPAVSFESKEATYTGQPVEHKLGDITGVDSVKYEYEGTGSTAYAKSDSAPVHAGTYNVIATFTMKYGYAQLEPISTSLTISKAEGSVTVLTAVADLVYNGSEQTLINEAASSTGEVQYKLGENGTYSTELPKALNAGKYNVYYKVAGDADHNDVAEASVEVTVNKAKLVITVNNKNAYVNDKAPELTAPELDKDYKVSGLIGDDTLTTAPSLKYVDAEGHETIPDMTKAGTITIGASGASAGDNYTVEYKTGTLTINNRRSSGGSSTPKYTVTAPKSTTGGSVKSDVSSAAGGSTVTVTVTAEEGYKIGGLKVTDSKGNEIKVTDKGNGKYTFTMPSDKVELTPVFTKEASEVGNELPFRDVAKDAYYYEAVKWAKDNGITGGVSNDLFGSNDSCTRGHIVTFLWRNAGSPEPKSVSSFSDVASNSYYAKAVAWAVENGITNGVGHNKFDPDAACTRAQSVAFLYRAIGKQVSSKAHFSDVPSNSYYADAVAWAAANDVTNGIGSGLFGSDNSCTRAQIVTFLYRAYQNRA